MKYLYMLLGSVLGFAYDLVGSYGLAIIIFTLIIKLLLFPLSIKQQKSSVAQMRVKPQEEHLRKKYANNKEKLNEELMELYKKEKVNPMSGCLPLLIQLPIIWALYTVINSPLSYILKLSSEVITKLQTALGIEAVAGAGARYTEIAIAEAMVGQMDKLAGIPELAGIHPIDFNFLGLNLAATPSIRQFGWLWVIPLFATVTAYLTGIVTQRQTGSNLAKGDGQAPQGAGMMKSMNLLMPLMSLWISFTVPAGVGLYWGMSSLFSIVQSFVLAKMFNPQKAYQEAKDAFESSTVKRKKRRRLEFEQNRLNPKNPSADETETVEDDTDGAGDTGDASDSFDESENDGNGSVTKDDRS